MNSKMKIDNNEQEPFGSSATRSVITRHRVSLPTTDETLKYMNELLHLRTLANHNAVIEENEEPNTQDRRVSLQVSEEHKGAVPVLFGASGLGDRWAELWDWPLGSVKMKNDENSFIVKLQCKPFAPGEIEAFVLGCELNIQCTQKESANRTDTGSALPRALHRVYQLPLDVDPTSVNFHIKECQDSWLGQIEDSVVSDWLQLAARQAANMLLDDDLRSADRMTKFLLDVAWEQLNTGHWTDVHVAWRRFYTFASIVRALTLYLQEKEKEALQCCDNGLVMGAPFVEENILTHLASEVHRHLVVRQPCRVPPKILEQEIVQPSSLQDVMCLFCQGIESRTEVKRLECPSLEQFHNGYLKSANPLPVVIEGALQSWPALTKWNIAYLLRIAGHRTVPVEIGSRYTDDDWTQKLVSVHELVLHYFQSEDDRPVGYLAQHELFHQVPELREDIRVPDYCCLACPQEDVEVNAWFGPKNTVSPLHTDPKDNLFAQAMGTKYVCLCSPQDSEFVYPMERGIMTNTSQVDMANPDFSRFPMLRKAHVYETIVNAGDLLFIPKGWWHYLKSLSTSFSVSFWFQPSESD